MRTSLPFKPSALAQEQAGTLRVGAAPMRPPEEKTSGSRKLSSAHSSCRLFCSGWSGGMGAGEQSKGGADRWLGLGRLAECSQAAPQR